jgi:predicted PhzF superfamily epimerase YddE/YHI9
MYMSSQYSSEFNLPTCAFASPNSTSNPSSYSLTWFSPEHEYPICGHGTLGAVSVLADLPEALNVHSFEFQTPAAGPLRAERAEDGQLQLDVPADNVDVLQGAEREKIANAVTAAIDGRGQVKGVWRGRLDVCVELAMHDGIHLGDIPVDYKPLVRMIPLATTVC